jgi:signal transduction histidine kinase
MVPASQQVSAVTGALRAALAGAPGRPTEQPAPGAQRIRFWRSAVIAEIVLALLLFTVYAVGPLWPSVLGLTVLAVCLPASLLGLGRPLSAWRCAWLATLLSMLSLWTWVPPAVAVYLLMAPAVYLYLVGVAYERRVLFGAWLATTSLSVLLVIAFLGPELTYLQWHNSFLSTQGVQLAVVALVVPTVVAVLSDNTRARRLAGQALAEQRLRSAEEGAARAILEERSRIARELHDVVAHHMSVIAIHAETAPYRVTDPPGPLVESFSVIRTSAVEALTELRRLLTLLRSHDGSADLTPQPGLAQLDDLIATARRSGLVIHARVLGAPRPLPPGVDLSAFRIVQEGLSNALRHASGATVWVDIEYAPNVLQLTVYNDRPDSDAPKRATKSADVGGDGFAQAGHGLLGMRERVAMLGGTLTTTPTPEGGFLVRAVLPLHAADGG